MSDTIAYDTDRSRHQSRALQGCGRAGSQAGFARLRSLLGHHAHRGAGSRMSQDLQPDRRDRRQGLNLQEKSMPKFNDNIRRLAKDNTDFRREILTNKHSQVVLMSIEPGDDIGEETHKGDQVLVFVKGEGKAVLDGKKSSIEKNSLVSVPAGTRHNFINTGDKP